MTESSQLPEAEIGSLAPELQALLILDFVGSTALVRELGDARSAELSYRVDRAIRKLVREQQGREIDKTDGFLLLFSHPLDAVRFALLSHQRLKEIARQEALRPGRITARIGIHFGEVILRPNNEEDVQAGAKPLEVDGLAKVFTARLMSLARGGQTLLSRSAFNLARDAAIGAGEFTSSIRWIAHGSYIFHGFDEAHEVFEVGAIGLAPLANPLNTEKAWRSVGPGEESMLGWRPAPGLPILSRSNYILSECLGKGGFGEVWLARDKTTQLPRVFKFCFQPDRLRGLKREVTLLRLLNENLGDRSDIVRVENWNFDQPPFYLELEYTDGGDLVEWANSHGGIEAVPFATRLELLAEVAAAIAAAHGVGVLHKDLKPSNILIYTDDAGKPRARLTDFGVGLLTDRYQLVEKGIAATGLTETLETASSDSSRSGTRLYTPPEVLEGKPPTIQSDIYSLGVVLYQVVAGDLTRALGPGWERDVPQELLCEDIRACIDRDPQRRLGDAREIANRLRNVEGRSEKLQRERQRAEDTEKIARELQLSNQRRRKLAVTVTAALFALAVIAGFAYRERSRAILNSKLSNEAQSEKAAAFAAMHKAQETESALRESRTKLEHETYRSTVSMVSAALRNGDKVSYDLFRTLASSPESLKDWEYRFLSYWACKPSEAIAATETFMPPLIANGNQLIIGTRNSSAIFDIKTSSTVRQFYEPSLVLLAAVSPDEKIILTTTEAGTATLWDSTSGIRKNTLDVAGASNQLALQKADTPYCFAMFNPDGSQVLLAYLDGRLFVFDSNSGRALHTAFLNTSFWRAAASPDLSTLAVVGQSSAIRIYDTKTGKLLRELERSNKAIPLDCAFHPEKPIIASGHDDGSVVLWDSKSFDQKSVLNEHYGKISRIHFSGDGLSLLAAGRDNRVVVWNLATLKVRSILSCASPLVDAVLDKAGKSACTQTQGSVMVWRIEPTTTCTVSTIDSAQLKRVHFRPCSAQLALVCNDDNLRIWNCSTAKIESTFQTSHGAVNDARFSHDGRCIASACSDGHLLVWDAEGRNEMADLDTGTTQTGCIAFSSDDNMVAVSADKGQIELWNHRTRTKIQDLHDDYLQHQVSQFDGDGLLENVQCPERSVLLAARRKPPGINIWNLASMTHNEMSFVGKEVTGMATCADADLVVCSAAGNQSFAYSLKDLKLQKNGWNRAQARVFRQNGLVNDVCASKNGKRIFTAGDDGTIRVWDTGCQECLLQINMPDHKKGISIALSDDGNYLASATDDGKLVVFKTAD
jgi:WD40 repeat protein/class 3 adenylate cyclase/tRNA A-37 threonylcarbamoyl transferase component Bud32